jgi:hypothetical protein
MWSRLKQSVIGIIGVIGVATYVIMLVAFPLHLIKFLSEDEYVQRYLFGMIFFPLRMGVAFVMTVLGLRICLLPKETYRYKIAIVSLYFIPLVIELFLWGVVLYRSTNVQINN